MPWWSYWVLAFLTYVAVFLIVVKVIGAIIKCFRGKKVEEEEEEA